jgi:hypothetical protein
MEGNNIFPAHTYRPRIPPGKKVEVPKMPKFPNRNFIVAGYIMTEKWASPNVILLSADMLFIEHTIPMMSTVKMFMGKFAEILVECFAYINRGTVRACAVAALGKMRQLADFLAGKLSVFAGVAQWIDVKK